MTSINVGFSSSKDFIEKLKREIWRLHEAQFDDKTDENILDHGLNAVITAWHLHEIIAKENSLSKDNYRDGVKSRCPDLGLMHDIATQTKHFQVSSPQRRNPQDTLEMKTSVRPYIAEDEWKQSRKDMEEFGIIVKNYEYKPLPYRVLKIEGREVEEILEDIRRFWERELNTFASPNSTA